MWGAQTSQKPEVRNGPRRRSARRLHRRRKRRRRRRRGRAQQESAPQALALSLCRRALAFSPGFFRDLPPELFCDFPELFHRFPELVLWLSQVFLCGVPEFFHDFTELFRDFPEFCPSLS